MNSPTKFVSGFRSEEKSSDPNRDLVKWSVSSDPDPPRLIKKRNIKSLYLLYICLQYLKDSVAVSEPRPFLEPNFDAAWTTRDVNVSVFCERTFRFFCPLEKKCVSFRFRFLIQRKVKIRLLFINKKLLFFSKRFIMFYSVKRTKYSLIFY